MTAHIISGWQPGTLVGLYHAAMQETSRAPSTAPILTAVAAESGAATFIDAPVGVALVAYGSRSDGRAGWVRAARSETAEPEPVPEFGYPKPPPSLDRPRFHVGARGSDVGRR